MQAFAPQRGGSVVSNGHRYFQSGSHQQLNDKILYSTGFYFTVWSAASAVVHDTRSFDYLGSMDIKTLKLELLERIALLEDEPRLLALKRLLDGPPTYTLPSEHLSVVREGAAPYLKLEDRMYTADEVRALVEEVLHATHAEGSSDDQLDEEELAELERRHQARLGGTSKGSPLKESMERLRSRGEQ